MFRFGIRYVGLFLFAAQIVLGCGFDFPNSYLMSSDDILTVVHRYRFPDEIRRIQLDEPANFPAIHDMDTESMDIKDLSESVKERGFASDHIASILPDYQIARKTLKSFDRIPSEVPEEFKLYLQGAAYYKAENYTQAIETWLKVMSLPESDRQYRSVWAMYMLGNCALKHRPHIAPLCYQRVRQLVQKGFKDSLGLAAASYGQEAAVYFRQGQYDKAIELYLQQVRTGHNSGMMSLRLVCRKVFERSDPKMLDTLVRHPKAVRVLLAYAISHYWDSASQALIDAIEYADLDMVQNADRMAVIAYKAGDFEKAKRWLQVAEQDSLLTRRIRAKIYLREGKLEEAATDLVFAAEKMGPADFAFYEDRNTSDSSYKVHSELGSLYVSKKMYTQAIDTLMRGGNWIDSAYIAERVLAPEELWGYVDLKWPASMLEPINDEDGFGPEGKKAMKIRYLLARRLSRHERYAEARPYYPADILEAFDTFTSALARANDGSVAQRERADAFWTAAWLMRHKGMEMFGFELDPDWTIFGGGFSMDDRLAIRQTLMKENIINVPDQDELERVRREVAIPDKRFHYRYAASDLAWEAAALMQNEDPELARRLCLAGGWTKARDPKHADVFYKSMVLRCGTTALGKEADKIRWFPKIPDILKEEPPVELPQEIEEPAAADAMDQTDILANSFPIYIKTTAY